MHSLQIYYKYFNGSAFLGLPVFILLIELLYCKLEHDLNQFAKYCNNKVQLLGSAYTLTEHSITA